MRRWSFGKRCWVQGGERKSKWLESVYKEELTNDLFPLAIDNLFLPKEDARGNTQPGALVGDTLPVLGHPEPTPLTEAEQPQWLLYLARMAETFGRTRDTFRITKQLFKLKCDKRELISLAELRLLDSAYTNTINPIRNMYKTGIRIERRLREQTRIRVQIGRKAADDKAFTAAESSLLASKEIEQTAENMLTLVDRIVATRKRNTNKADEVIENIIITKLQADSLRYLAEVGSELTRGQDIIKRTREAYRKAITDGRDGGLVACHPLLLSCGLNMSVFYATVLDDRDKAANFAKTIHDNGAAAIRLVIDSSTYQTSFATLRLLHANVVKWSDEAAKEERGRRTRELMEEQQERRISAAPASRSIAHGGSDDDGDADDAASEGNDAASSSTRGSRTSQSSSGSATNGVTASTTSPSTVARTKSGRRATELVPLPRGGFMLVDKVPSKQRPLADGKTGLKS